MKEITFREYRNIDITVWAVMTLLFEVITTFATVKWFYAQPVALSVTLAIVCAVMVRWNGYAALMAVIGGFATCIVSGASAEQYVIYCVGNVFALCGMLVIKWLGKEKIAESFMKKMLFAIVSYAGLVIGRWLVSLLFGGDLTALLVYATTDIMSLLFAIVILFVLSKCDGMLEDQKAYLFRLERERKESEGCPDSDEGIIL